MPDTHSVTTGSCNCGGVEYRITGPLKPVIGCHCTLCRKQTGHFYATADAWKDHFELTQDRGLRWYASSDRSRRGFCGECGSALFFETAGEDKISVTAGTIDGVTGLRFAAHIFVDDKGDYYDINDGTPQHAQGGHAVPMPPRE